MQLTFEGRIEHMRTRDGKHTTIVATKAPDAYSQPSSFCVRSDHQLGQLGEEISVDVKLSGFVKKKPYTNKQTGVQDVFWEEVTIFTFLKANAVKKSDDLKAVS